MAFWINIDEGGGGNLLLYRTFFGDILELMVKIVQIPIRYSHVCKQKNEDYMLFRVAEVIA